MKAKTIKTILRNKIQEWATTLPEDLKKEVLKNTIVTGGCIASMLLKEKVNDFDIYFRNRATALKVAAYYVAKFKEDLPTSFYTKKGIPIPIYIATGYNKNLFGDEVKGHKPIGLDYIPKEGDERDQRIKIIVKSAGIASTDDTDKEYEYFEGRDDGGQHAADYVNDLYDVVTDPEAIEDTFEEEQDIAQEKETTPKYQPVFLSTNAITLSNKIQIIIRFWGEPDQIHENYDFVHCMCYWTSWDGKLELRPAAMEAMLARELRYVGSKYPICSIIRVRKFIKRNWTINAGQILKMVMQAAQLNLNDVNVLEEQLTGVDVAYFNQVISMLKAKDNERVDTAYLLEIIDRMF